jgi:predicted PhzF superfamily epimerase YddE/YHI9
VRYGPADDGDVARAVAALRIDPAQVVAAHWVDNGPGWLALLLPDAEQVLAVRPGPVGDLDLGIAAPHDAGAATAYEVRAFFGKDGATVEDPVTGSLNASLARWLLDSGRVRTPYVAAQGTVLGRAGRVHVDRDDAGQIWVGGGTVTCVEGSVEL